MSKNTTPKRLYENRFCFEKQSTDSGVTDINLGINGWILFSLLHVKLDSGETDTTLIIFNYRLWERWTH